MKKEMNKVKLVAWALIVIALVASVLLVLGMVQLRNVYQQMILTESQEDKRQQYETYRTTALTVAISGVVLAILSIAFGGYVKNLGDS